MDIINIHRTEYDAMLPPQGGEFLGKLTAVWTLVYSAVFGSASVAQAAGIIIPLAFLAYKWKNEGLRRRVLEKILKEEDDATRAQMVAAMKASNTTPGKL